jgi:tRNA dimethylallyltransferase
MKRRRKLLPAFSFAHCPANLTIHMEAKPKVIAIVGPTAAGKTSLSIKVAKHIGGEVISADSRQVYRGMDLGTGKITPEEMDGVPHHLLDVADPMEIYTGSRFVTDATAAIEGIINRNHCPVVAGGTFFYVDLLRNKIQAAPVEPDLTYRQELANYSDNELFELLEQKDPRRAANIDQYNRRRVERALEIIKTLGTVPKSVAKESPYDWLIFGIEITKEQLHDNIYQRIISRVEQGMIEEVERLHYEGVTWERMDALGLEYRYIAKYLQDEITKEDMIEQLYFKTRQFAKQQLTWLKKDPEIQWIDPTFSAAKTPIKDFLNM